jgi:hypothetical protein
MTLRRFLLVLLFVAGIGGAAEKDEAADADAKI